MRKLNYPSQDEVKRLFDYDPTTGHLITKCSTKGYHAGRRLTRLTGTGYYVTTLNNVGYRVHHLVWIWHYGEHVNEIDHINRVKTDNRIENLRSCEHVPNCGNSAPRVHAYKGVTFCRTTGKWKAQIGKNYRNYSLGRFDKIEDAAKAYNRAALEHFGNFAYLNDV